MWKNMLASNGLASFNFLQTYGCRKRCYSAREFMRMCQELVWNLDSYLDFGFLLIKRIGLRAIKIPLECSHTGSHSTFQMFLASPVRRFWNSCSTCHHPTSSLRPGRVTNWLVMNAQRHILRAVNWCDCKPKVPLIHFPPYLMSYIGMNTNSWRQACSPRCI